MRRKLTAGYERINKMKNSITKVETCRAKLKVKQERILQEVKAMMNQIAAQLFQLQQFIEVTVKATVTEREKQLDAKKQEIHDGYAKLVQVCVEADKVLRGRNDDLLGRSCQRLFNSFDAAKFKLDVAEKIDVEGITGFEFQDNTKQFLSSTFVAKLQHFDRSHKLVEVDEFWVDGSKYQTSQIGLPVDRKKEPGYVLSNHVDSFNNNRPAASRRSPDRSLNEPPRPPLATIQEVPEDNGSYRGQKVGLLRRRLASSIDIVHIRETELCLDRELENDPANKMKIAKSHSAAIRPPPGFSPLPACDLPSRYTHEDVDVQPAVRCSTNPLSSPDISSDSSPPGRTSEDAVDCWSAGCFGDSLSGVSNPDTSLTSEPNAVLSCASSKSTRTYSSPVENTKSEPKKNKPEERSRDEEDFIWESDDSVDIPSSELGSEKIPLTDSSGISEHATQSELSSVPPQTEQGVGTSHSSKPVTLPSLKLAESSKSVCGSPKLMPDPYSPQKPPTGDVGKSASGSVGVSDSRHKPTCGAPKGFPGSPYSKNIALKMFEQQFNSRCSAAEKDDHPCCPNAAKCSAAPDINIVLGQTSDHYQYSVKEECEHSVTEEQPDKVQEEETKQPVLNAKEEDANLHAKEEGSRSQMREEISLARVKIFPIKMEPEETIESKPVKTEPEEAAASKIVEVLRPVKTHSKRLDLSHMLEHVGGCLFGECILISVHFNNLTLINCHMKAIHPR